MPVKRVSFLTTSYPLSAQSLSGVFVWRLVRALSASVAIEVITPADTDVVKRQTAGGVTVMPCRYAPRHWQRLAHTPGGIPVALNGRPMLRLLLPVLLLSMFAGAFRGAGGSDLLHANWAVCGCIAGLAGFLRRRPVITTLRGDDVTRARRALTDRLLLRLCAALSARIVCVSADMRAWLDAEFPKFAAKTELIENGVDEAFLAMGEGRDYARASGPVRLIAVGSLIPRKGFDQIIHAVGRAAKRIDVTLTIVGSGPEEAALRALVAAERLEKQVILAGAVAAMEIPARLGAADVFVLASHSEGRPNVLVEALASGLPAIATDIPGNRELIDHGHTGLLFRDGEVDDLASEIVRLGGDPELRRGLGTRGRELVLRRGLTWKGCAAKHLALYAAVAAG